MSAPFGAGGRRAFRLPWSTAARIDRDLDDELAFHLEMRVREMTEQGLPEDEARREAMRRFGDMDDARRYCRAADRRRGRVVAFREWVESWGQDVRYALRQLARSPGFTLVAVITLALGIGANTAIFSVVRRLVLDPFPYRDGERIVWLTRSMDQMGGILMTPRLEMVEAWRARARTVESISIFSHREVALTGGCGAAACDPEIMEASLIEPAIPRFLGVQPVLGRTFAPDEGKPGAPKVVLIGYGLWQRRLGGARDVLGRSMEIDGAPHTIVGVMPRDFDVPMFGPGREPMQLWLPYLPQKDDASLSAIAKLREGVGGDAASKELSAILATVESNMSHPGESARALTARDFLDRRTGVRETLLTLLVAVGVVLVIACANLANLLLARSTARQREMAVRAAIGAGRGRLIRQLLTESVCLSIIGGALGLLVAWQGLEAMIALRPSSLADLDMVRLDPVMLAVTAGLSLVTGLLFGLAPSLLGTGRGVGEVLKGVGRSVAGGLGGRRFRNGLVVAQVALSVTLLIAAGLLVRSVRGLQRFDVGFQPAGLVAAEIALPEDRFTKPEQRQAVLDPLLAAARRLPGGSSAVLASDAPPERGLTFGELEVEGQPMPEKPAPRAFSMTFAPRDYFALVGLRFREGGPFTGDTAGNPIIINRAMAAKLWPGQPAVGRRVRFGLRGSGDWSTIIGVVDDVRLPSRQSRGNIEQLYVPFVPFFPTNALVLRMDATPRALLPEITRMAAAIDPGIVVRRVISVDSRIESAVAGPRFSMALLAVFAALALVLSAVGLYGVIAYSVAQRTREIGVRIALGAAPSSVLRLVVGNGLRLAAVGVAVGLLLAAAVTRSMSALLYQVSPLDPATFAVVGLLLGGVALLASFFPARVAARVDPAVALRAE